MNILLLLAGILTVILALLHCILGELKIFSKLDKAEFPVQLKGFPLLWKVDHAARRTLRMVWHVTAVFGSALSGILIYLGMQPDISPVEKILVGIIAASMIIAGLVSLFVVKGSHVSWVVFLLIGILAMLGI